MANGEFQQFLEMLILVLWFGLFVFVTLNLDNSRPEVKIWYISQQFNPYTQTKVT